MVQLFYVSLLISPTFISPLWSFDNNGFRYTEIGCIFGENTWDWLQIYWDWLLIHWKCLCTLRLEGSQKNWAWLVMTSFYKFLLSKIFENHDHDHAKIWWPWPIWLGQVRSGHGFWWSQDSTLKHYFCHHSSVQMLQQLWQCWVSEEWRL